MNKDIEELKQRMIDCIDAQIEGKEDGNKYILEDFIKDDLETIKLFISSFY